MLVKVFCLVFWILFCTLRRVKGVTYADDVKNLFKRHFHNPNNICWNTAMLKANKYMSDEDKGMAIALVNVYTQQCKDYIEASKVPFYEKLNNKLRANTKEQIWLDTEKLLNKGLDILGMTMWKTLYRACKCDNIIIGHSFQVDYFWSTSVLPEVANNFLNKSKIFFEILKAPRGAKISEYSHYPSETEVLLQSKREFYALEYVEDKVGIETKKSGVKGVYNEMKAFAVVTADIPAGVPKSGNCDCTGGTKSDLTSDALMLSSFNALFVIVFRIGL